MANLAILADYTPEQLKDLEEKAVVDYLTAPEAEKIDALYWIDVLREAIKEKK